MKPDKKPSPSAAEQSAGQTALNFVEALQRRGVPKDIEGSQGLLSGLVGSSEEGPEGQQTSS